MACGSSAATSAWSFAFSMNVRAVTMSAISAAAARGDRRRPAPVEKLSIAGTRCSACSAKKVTSAAREVGSSTPTRSPARVRRASAPPSA